MPTQPNMQHVGNALQAVSDASSYDAIIDVDLEIQAIKICTDGWVAMSTLHP